MIVKAEMKAKERCLPSAELYSTTASLRGK